MEKKTIEKLAKCEICPRMCKVNRLEGKTGFCKCDEKITVLHLVRVQQSFSYPRRS